MGISKRVRSLRRQQVERRLEAVRSVAESIRPPRDGWIATLRENLGMSQAELASRLSVTQQAVQQLEKREAEGTVTLNALRDAARALDSELLWAIVPAKPLTTTLEERARQVALRMVRSTEHTMKLEDQATEDGLESRIEEIVEQLLESPERLWSLPDDG